MRIELERIKGKRTDREVDSLILTEGTLSYCVKGEEFNIDLENIDSLIVTDSPDATLRAENETLRAALELIAAGSPPTPGDDRIPVSAADVAATALAKGGER